MRITRKLERKTSRLAAYAMVEGDDDAIFCVVRDLTPIGAKLDIASSAALPDRFDLQIAGRERIWRAHVRWRSPDGLGVRFLPPSAAG